MWCRPRRYLGAAVLVAVLAAGAALLSGLQGLVVWSLQQPGGVIPVALLTAASLLLNDDILSQGRGLDVPSSLVGKVALVTGSTQGIGLEAAKLLHKLGSHVVVSGRSQAGSEERAAAIRDGHGRRPQGLRRRAALRCRGLRQVRGPVHIGKAAIEGLGPELPQRMGFAALDYLLLNAAYSGGRTPETLAAKSGHDSMYVTNYLSNFLLVRLLMHKIAAGGSVVLVSSVVMWGARFDLLMPEGGRFPWEKRPDIDPYQQYQVSKLALCVCFRDSLNLTLGKKGVRIRSMVPGFIVTNMTAGVWSTPLYKPWVYMRLGSVEVGGRLLFESAFATPRAPDHDFLYAFWLPSSIFGQLRPQAHWEFRVGITGFFAQPQAYQQVYGMRLHSSVSPECEEGTRRALWSWSSNATGLSDEL